MRMFQGNTFQKGCGCYSQNQMMNTTNCLPIQPCATNTQMQTMGGYNCGTKTNIAPPVCHPVQEKVVHTYETTIVPHIFPSHTKMIHHHMYQLQNHYPHTVSNEVEQCCVQQNCGC